MSNKLCGSQHNFLCHVAPVRNIESVSTVTIVPVIHDQGILSCFIYGKSMQVLVHPAPRLSLRIFIGFCVDR